MQTSKEQAQLNTSATFVEMLDILVKIVPLKMPLATFVKRLAIILKCVKRRGNRCIDAIKKTAAIQGTKLATLSASETLNNTRVLCSVKTNGIFAKSMDTGSFDCYIDRRFADKQSLNIRRAVGEVTLAETSVRMPIRGQCITHILVKQ